VLTGAYLLATQSDLDYEVNLVRRIASGDMLTQIQTTAAGEEKLTIHARSEKPGLRCPLRKKLGYLTTNDAVLNGTFLLVYDQTPRRR
jgi:hypothetical protein